ncbi:MAG: GntR family transcriptional regulator [Desulfobacter sp.]|nr:MAG: GntR family transcriptional regulator [Desulfobacter sp.]
MPDLKSQPEYYRVKEYITGLLNGTVPAHGKLPSERELCEKFSVNRNTVRHAMRILEREGAIYSAGRRGWFAGGRRLVLHLSRNFVNFDRLVRSQNMHPEWEIIDQGKIPATGELSTLLQAPETTPLYFSNEVGLVDGRKVYYDENYFPAARCPGILPKLTDRPTTDVWREDYKVASIKEYMRIRPIVLHSHVSEHLGVSAGTPGLFIRSIRTDPDKEVIWLEYTFWRSDAIELRLEN